ncbi:MAG: hypothetical protein AAF449_17400, partial [Myxococcota bacterium]
MRVSSIFLCAGCLSAFVASPGRSLAEPILNPGPKPGVAQKWRTDEASVILTIDPRFDAEEPVSAHKSLPMEPFDCPDSPPPDYPKGYPAMDVI